MIVHYAENKELKIVPAAKGFDVVRKKTGEIVIHTKMLYEAEKFILFKLVEKSMVDSAAEFRSY